MLDTHQVGNELRLSDDSRLRLNYSPTAHSLSVEVWKPGRLRDGHGLLCAASALLRGEALAEVVRAVGRLREVAEFADSIRQAHHV